VRTIVTSNGWFDTPTAPAIETPRALRRLISTGATRPVVILPST